MKIEENFALIKDIALKVGNREETNFADYLEITVV